MHLAPCRGMLCSTVLGVSVFTSNSVQTTSTKSSQIFNGFTFRLYPLSDKDTQPGPGYLPSVHPGPGDTQPGPGYLPSVHPGPGDTQPGPGYLPSVHPGPGDTQPGPGYLPSVHPGPGDTQLGDPFVTRSMNQHNTHLCKDDISCFTHVQ